MADSNFNRDDRDLLVELRTEMVGARADIKDLKDGTGVQLQDHETRIRFIERYMWLAIGALGLVEILIRFIK